MTKLPIGLYHVHLCIYLSFEPSSIPFLSVRWDFCLSHHDPKQTCISYAVEPLSTLIFLGRIVHPTGHCSGGFISLVPVFSVTMEPVFISTRLIFLSQLCQVLSALMLSVFCHDSEAHRDNPYLHLIKNCDCVFLLPGGVKRSIPPLKAVFKSGTFCSLSLFGLILG